MCHREAWPPRATWRIAAPSWLRPGCAVRPTQSREVAERNAPRRALREPLLETPSSPAALPLSTASAGSGPGAHGPHPQAQSQSEPSFVRSSAAPRVLRGLSCVQCCLGCRTVLPPKTALTPGAGSRFLVSWVISAGVSGRRWEMRVDVVTPGVLLLSRLPQHLSGQPVWTLLGMTEHLCPLQVCGCTGTTAGSTPRPAASSCWAAGEGSAVSAPLLGASGREGGAPCVLSPGLLLRASSPLRCPKTLGQGREVGGL